MAKRSKAVYVKSRAERIRVMLRVLRFVDGYLKRMSKSERGTLRTDGIGLATVDELRQHISGALAIREPRRKRRATR